MALRENCLEADIGQVFRYVLYCIAPGLACLSTAVGAHSACWLLGDVPRWIAPTSLLCGLGWLVLGLYWAWRRCPVRKGLPSLLAALQEATGIRAPRPPLLIVGVLLLVIALALPSWAALISWTLILFLAIGYPRWGAVTFYVLGGVLMAFGLALAVWPFLVSENTSWLGPTLAGCLVVESATGFVILLVTTRRWASRFSHLVWVLPAAFPWLLPLCRSNVQVGFVLLTALLLWPGLTLLLVEILYRVALGKARHLLAEHELKTVLGRDADGAREDPLRESDGYCQLFHPEFRHWCASLTGETGYLTWFRPFGDCIVFRSTSLFMNSCLSRPDRVGMVLATLVRDLIPDLGLPRVEHLTRAFQDGWNVARLAPREIPLAKMPWDHPFLLTIPVTWTETFIFPPGSGVHDRDEFPCFARRVSVRIQVREEVLTAVDHCSNVSETTSDEPQAAVCRTLLWNAWRILPGAYESLLTLLVEVFRDVSVTLFMEHDDDFMNTGERRVLTGSKMAFLQRLNELWSTRLPPPLGTLIEVAVLDMYVDTYLVGDVRKKIFHLRVREANRPLDLQACVNDIRKPIADLFTTAQEAQEEETGQTLGLKMITELEQAKQEILKVASGSRDSVSEQLGRMEEGAPRDAFPEAQGHITAGHDRFAREVDERFAAISGKLKEVVRIYGERTW